jgi:hypothetical protein
MTQQPDRQAEEDEVAPEHMPVAQVVAAHDFCFTEDGTKVLAVFRGQEEGGMPFFGLGLETKDLAALAEFFAGIAQAARERATQGTGSAPADTYGRVVRSAACGSAANFDGIVVAIDPTLENPLNFLLNRELAAKLIIAMKGELRAAATRASISDQIKAGALTPEGLARAACGRPMHSRGRLIIPGRGGH